MRAVRAFCERSVHRRGHVDFIYLALRQMPRYGVQRDLAVYNLLLDVFPKEVFRPRNMIQRIFQHFPRQQECGLAVLEQMENYGAPGGDAWGWGPVPGSVLEGLVQGCCWGNAKGCLCS